MDQDQIFPKILFVSLILDNTKLRRKVTAGLETACTEKEGGVRGDRKWNVLDVFKDAITRIVRC